MGTDREIRKVRKTPEPEYSSTPCGLALLRPAMLCVWIVDFVDCLCLFYSPLLLRSESARKKQKKAEVFMPCFVFFSFVQCCLVLSPFCLILPRPCVSVSEYLKLGVEVGNREVFAWCFGVCVQAPPVLSVPQSSLAVCLIRAPVSSAVSKMHRTTRRPTAVLCTTPLVCMCMHSSACFCHTGRTFTFTLYFCTTTAAACVMRYECVFLSHYE